MVRSNLMLLFWGLIVVVIDVKLDSFDVLFDPVGFGLIGGALVSLGRTERTFSSGVPFALGAIPVSLMEVLRIGPQMLVTTVDAVLQFFVFWWICTGVMRLAQARGHVALIVSATRQRTLSFAAAAIGLAVTGIAELFAPITPALVLPAVGFAMVVLALTLIMLRQAAQELA